MLCDRAKGKGRPAGCVQTGGGASRRPDQARMLHWPAVVRGGQQEGAVSRLPQLFSLTPTPFSMPPVAPAHLPCEVHTPSFFPLPFFLEGSASLGLLFLPSASFLARNSKTMEQRSWRKQEEIWQRLWGSQIGLKHMFTTPLLSAVPTTKHTS